MLRHRALVVVFRDNEEALSIDISDISMEMEAVQSVVIIQSF